MSPRVVHCKSPVNRPGTVYVGRPSKWGNPHVAGWCARCKRNHTRAEAIAAFEVSLNQNPALLAALPELAGRDLSCWCTRKKGCHADVLIRRANPLKENTQ